MSYMRAVIALLRQLRADRAMIASLAITVLLTSGLAAAVPRVYNRVLDAELQQRVEKANPHQRSITATLTQRYNNPNQEILPRLVQMGSDYRDALPRPLHDALSEPSFSFESPAVLIVDGLDSTAVPFARLLKARYDSEIETQIEMTAGRLPRPRQPAAAPTSDALSEEFSAKTLDLLEVALSDRAAQQLQLQPGDRLLAIFDDDESIFDQGSGNLFFIEISGTFRSTGESDETTGIDLDFDLVRRRDDITSLPIARGRTEATRAAVGTALLAPEAYLGWMKATETERWTYQWQYGLDPTRLNATNYQAVVAQARGVEVTKGPYQSPDWMPGGLQIRSPISQLFQGFKAQTQFTLSVIALIALGVFGAAAVTFALMGTLISDRRRAATLLIRGRGATRAQLIGARLLEGVVVCSPAAALGYLIAITVIDARGNNWSIRGAVGIAATMTLLLLITAEPLRVANLGQLLRRSLSPTRHSSRRRLTLEVTIVVLAIAALAAFRQRGVTANADSNTALDPLLIAAPLLLALAVGLVGYRAYPHAINLLARLAKRNRGLIWFVGLRRGSNPNDTSFLPFIVLLVAVSVAVFASIISQSLSEAQRETAWRRVGADARIEASAFDPSILEGELPNDVEIATALVTDGSVSMGDETVQLTAIALDVNAYHRVIGNRQPPFELPPENPPTSEDIGTEQNPVPAMLSAYWPDDERPDRGAPLQVTMRIPGVGTAQFYTHIAGSSDQYPGVAAGEPFILIPDVAFRALAPQRAKSVTAVFVRGPDDEARVLAATIQDRTSTPDSPNSVDVFLRNGVYEDLLEQPLTHAVMTSFRAGILLAAAYASLALLLALLLTARRRTYDLSVLRTLGLPLRRAASIIVIEFLPIIAASSLAGVVLGIVTAFAIEPAIDLGAFTGAEAAISLAINWVLIVAIVLALSAVALVTIGAYMIWSRRQQLGATLRVSD